MWAGKPLKALFDWELADAVRSMRYQSLAAQSEIAQEAERRWREEGVDFRPMSSFVEQK